MEAHDFSGLGNLAGEPPSAPAVDTFGQDVDAFGQIKIPLEERLKDEPVMAVLRPEIPVAHGTPATSWLGGLPQMPEHIEWPTTPSSAYPDRGEIALNFIGQICCADLPKGLWGGRGPREGWLLFFIDAQEPDPALDLNPHACQVIYIDALGPEREPPVNTWPVTNPDYAGIGPYLRYPEDAPVTWRRCPVDPIEFATKAEQSFVSWDETSYHPFSSDDLFPGLPVGRDAVDGNPEQVVVVREWDPLDPENWPFTRRGAVYVMDSLIVTAGEQLAGNWHAHALVQDQEFLAQPGAAETLHARLATHTAELENLITQAETSLRAAELDTDKEHFERRLKFLNTSRTETAALHDKLTALIGTDCAPLLAEMKATHAQYDSWKEAVVERLIALRGELAAGDLDDALSQDAFRRIHDQIWNESGAYLSISKDRATDTDIPTYWPYDLRLWYKNALQSTQDVAAFDACFGSQKAASAIPERRSEHIKANAREFKRPFKMGGLHDGLNSVVTDYGPYLLFQAGDSAALTSLAGALYIFVDGVDLEKCTFDKVRWVREY